MSGTFSSGTYSETYQFVGEFVDRVTAPADQASVSLGNLGSAATDMSGQLKAATDAVSAGLGKLEASANNASSRGFNTLQRSIDPLGASLRRAEADLTKLNARIAAGGSELDKYNALLPVATAKVEDLRKKHDDYVRTAGEATTQNKALGFAMRDLSTQSIDLFQGLATGQPIFRTLIQQGSQIVQVNKQMGVGFGEMAAAVGSRLLNPLTLAVAAVAALGAAFVGLIVWSEKAARSQGALATALAGSRVDYQQAAATIEESSRKVASSLDSSNEQIKKAQQLLLTQGHFQGTAEDLSKITQQAEALGKVMGTDLPTAMKLFADAARDPIAAAQQIAKTPELFRLVSSSTIDLAIRTAEAGDKAKATQLIMNDLTQALKIQNENLTPLQRQWKESDEAFHGIVESIRSLGLAFGDFLKNQVVETVKGVKEFIDLIKQIPALVPSSGVSGGPQLSAREPGNIIATPIVPGPIADQLNRATSSLNPFGQSLYQALIGNESGGNQFDNRGGVLTSPAGALGIGQVMPQMAQGHDLTTTQGNIAASSEYFIHIYQKYGGNPTLVVAAYNMGETALDKFLAAGSQGQLPIETQGLIGRVLGTLGSAGVNAPAGGYGVNLGAGGGTTGRSPIGSQDLGRGQFGPQTATDFNFLEDARKAVAGQFGAGTAKQIADVREQLKDVTAQYEIYRKSLGDADASTKEYASRVGNLREQLANLLDPTREDTRAALQSADVQRKLGEADQKLLQIRQGIANYNQEHQNQPITEAQAQQKLLAVQTELSAQYERGIDIIQRDTANKQKQVDAYQQGGKAAADADIANKAYLETLKTTSETAPDFTEKVNRMTDALQAQQKVSDALALAPMKQALKDQTELLNTEISTLGENNDTRNIRIDLLRTEQALMAAHPELSKEAVKGYLQEKEAVDQLNQTLQARTRDMDLVAGQFSTAFDTIGNAITQSFVQGQGAAVNFGNVMKSVATQVIQAFLKLAIINPLINSLFGGQGGQTLPTLFSVFDTLSGGGTGGGGGGGGGNLLSVGGAAYQGYSLFNGKGIFGGLGRLYNGISPNLGAGGIFSPGGIAGNYGNVSAFFNQGIFGTSSLEATNNAIAGLGPGVFGPAEASAVQAPTGILGGATIGGLATGILGGFGAGSLAGGLLQGALGKTGPGPQIGAGGGAIAGAAIGSIVPGIGTVIGGLIGGLIGGAGGGLIGPKPPSPYQATFVGIGANGQLSVDPRLSASQLSPSNLQAIQNEVGAFNQNLNTLGVQVLGVRNPPPAGYAGGLGFFGQAKNPAGLAGQSVTDVFSNLKFGAQAGVFGTDETDVLNRYINNKTFQTFTDLGQAVDKVRTFMERTLPAMRKYGENVGSLQQAIDQIAAAFDPAIATAHDLGYAEEELTTKREQQIAKAQQQADQQFRDIDAGLNARYITATASSPFDQLNANVTNFDIQAQQQRTQLSDQLKAVYGDAVTETEGFGLHMASLERTLGAERLAILKQFDEAYFATLQQAADTVNTIAVRQIQAGAALSDNRLGSLVASLTAFDLAADQQRRQLQATFKGMFGDLGLQTKEYADSAVRLDVSLAQERLAIQKQFSDRYEAAVRQTRDIEIGLAIRQQQASATLSGDPAQILNANLAAFDAQAQQQRAQLRDQFQAMYGDVYTQLIDFTISSAALEKTLGLERLAVQKQANDAIVADQKAAMDRARQSATGLVTQLTDYARNLQYGGQSPLSPLQQLDAAQKEFNAVSGAARAGNAESYAKLSSYSDTLLNAGRAVYGSGEGYANLFRLVTDTLGQVAAVPEDTLTASVYQLETRTQTQTLVDAIAALRSEVAGLRAQVAAGSAMPDRLAA